METLSATDQSLIAMAMRDGISDRGSHCLERDGQVLLFHEVSGDLVVQAGHTPENYPSWFLNTSRCDEDGLREKLKSLVEDGWSITKTQFDDLLLD